MSTIDESGHVDERIVAFPQPRPSLFGEPEVYAELRERCPIVHADFPNGTTGWLATRHEDVKAVARDPRFSSDPARSGFPQVYKGYTKPSLANGSIISMDDPDHRAQRGLIQSYFTNRTAETYREAICGCVDELIDRLLTQPQPVDLVSHFTLPLPMWVVCLLFGVSPDLRDFITERTTVRLSYDSTEEEVERATTELQDCIRQIAEDKRAAPGEDLFSLIVQANAGGELSEKDMIDMMQLLIVAGHETTANSLSLSVVALLEHPDQLAELLADRTRLRPAVEELLRYASIAQTMLPRVATEDVEVAGHVIKAGEGIRALVHSANFDESVFEDPARFDIHRDARRHLAFGFGAHMCIGQAYARMEMQEGLWQLFTRLPGLRVAVPHDELDVKWNAGVHGLASLPVTWDPPLARGPARAGPGQISRPPASTVIVKPVT